MRDKMPFKQALAWGIKNVNTKKAGEKLSADQKGTHREATSQDHDVDRLKEQGSGKKANKECPWCGLSHEFGTNHCPAYGSKCHECGQMGHWQNRKKCKGKQPKNPKKDDKKDKNSGSGKKGKGVQTIKYKGKDGKTVTQSQISRR